MSKFIEAINSDGIKGMINTDYIVNISKTQYGCLITICADNQVVDQHLKIYYEEIKKMLEV